MGKIATVYILCYNAVATRCLYQPHSRLPPLLKLMRTPEIINSSLSSFNEENPDDDSFYSEILGMASSNSTRSPIGKGENENKVTAPHSSDKSDCSKRGGVAANLRGITFHKQIVLVVICSMVKLMRAEKEVKFTINSDDEKTEKFDDVVLRCKIGSEAFNLFIQAKTKANVKKTIELKHLLCTEKKDYALYQYFNDYRSLKKDSKATNIFAICSTIGIGEDLKPYLETCSHDNILSSVLTDISRSVYKLKWKNFDTETNDPIINYLMENSDLQILAKRLATSVLSEKQIIFNVPVFKKYRPLIKKMITGYTKTNKSYTLNKQFFDKPEVADHPFMKHFKAECLKVLEPKNKEFDFVFQEIFRQIDGKLENPDNEVDNFPEVLKLDDIEAFYNSFRLICSTNLEKENQLPYIANIIDENLSKPSQEFIYERLSTWVMEHMGDTGAQVNEQNVSEFYDCSVFSLHYLKLDSLTQKNCASFRNEGYKCKIERLKESKLFKKLITWFSDKKTQETTLEKVHVSRNFYPSWFIDQICQHVRNVIKNGLHFLFLDEQEFAQDNEKVKKAFSLIDFPLILVIALSKRSTKELFTEYSNWNSLENNSRYKKMIITFDEYSQSDKTDSPLLFEHLTDDCKDTIVCKNFLLLGTLTPCEDIFKDKDVFSYVAEVLSFEQNSVLRRNINKDRYELIKEFYIHRELLEYGATQPESRSICYYRKFNLVTDMDDELTTESRTQKRVPIERFLLGGRFYKTEELSAEKFETVSHLHTPNILLPEPSLPELKVKSVKIFNHAGQGKSYFMTWLANFLQSRKDLKDFWVIKINLISHVTDFSETQFNGQENIQIETIRLLFLLVFLDCHENMERALKRTDLRKTAITLSNYFQFTEESLVLNESKLVCSAEHLVMLRIFLSKFNHRKLIVMMDGFDEIAPDYQNIVLKMLETLHSLQGVCKLFVSSRPYDFKREMDSALGADGYFYLPNFSKKQIYGFAFGFLSQMFEGYKSFKEQVKGNILELHIQLLNMFLSNMATIPLFLWLGMTVLSKIVKKNLIDESYINPQQTLSECEKLFSPLCLISFFISEKLTITLEKDGTCSKTPNARNVAEQSKKIMNETHSILAILALNEEVQELLSPEQQEAGKSYILKLKNSTEKSGVINGVVDDVPIFVHRIFVDYFAALWFFHNAGNSKVRDFLKNNMFERQDFADVRKMLETKICESNEINAAVLDESIVKVTMLLKKCPDLIQQTDAWGRTALHLALLYRREPIVCLLLDSMERKDYEYRKDQFFCWTALDFAFKMLRIKITDNEDRTRAGLNKLFKFESKILTVPPSVGRNRRAEFVKLLFSKFVHQSFLIHQQKKASSREWVWNPWFKTTDLSESQSEQKDLIFLLKCIDRDSLLFQIVVEQAGIDISSKGATLLKEAEAKRSINALKFLIVKCQTDIPDTLGLESELLMLVAFMEEDPMKFQDAFQKYCEKHKIAHLQDGTLEKKLVEESLEKSFLMQSDLLCHTIPHDLRLPSKLGIDSGTELLICLAIHTKNLSILNHLFLKFKNKLSNTWIQHLLLNNRIHWHESTLKFLVQGNKQFENADDLRRNLLILAIESAEFNIVKMLLDLESNTTEIDSTGKHYDAYFSCVKKNSAKSKIRAKIFDMVAEFYKDLPEVFFNHKDKKGESIFYHAVKNVPDIAYQIIQRQFSKPLKNLNETDILELLSHFEIDDFNAEDILKFVPKIRCTTRKVCEKACDILVNNKKCDYTDSNARNVLQIAIYTGNFDIAECLVTRHIFQIPEDPVIFLSYYGKHYLRRSKLCISICKFLKSNNKLDYKDSTGRNLLHIAIQKSWIVLAHCLMKHFNFKAVTEIGNEKNYAAFFYCIKSAGAKEILNKRDIFSFLFYMIDKHKEFNCLSELDSEGKSIVWYAYHIDFNMAIKIFERKWRYFRIPVNESEIKQTAYLTNVLQSAGFNSEEIISFLKDCK